MATASSVNLSFEDIHENFFTCSICMEGFTVPKCLPCLHNFCQHCLEGYLDRKGNPRQFQCPICCQNINIPPGGVSGFVTNFFVMNLKEVIGSQLPDKNCDMCSQMSEGKKVIATSRCIQCSDYLCAECTAIHQRTKYTLDHKVVPISELYTAEMQSTLRSTQTIKCQTHPEEPVKYFCRQDSSVLCRDCAILMHSGHKCVSLKEAADEYKDTLKTHLRKLNDVVLKQEQTMEVIKQHKIESSQMCSKVEKDIKAWAKEMRLKLRGREKQLLDELTVTSKLEEKTNQAVGDESELKHGTLKSISEMGQQVLRHGQDAEILLLQTQMTERIQQLEREPMEHPIQSKTTFTLQVSSTDINSTKLIKQVSKVADKNIDTLPNVPVTTNSTKRIRQHTHTSPVTGKHSIKRIKTVTPPQPPPHYKTPQLIDKVRLIHSFNTGIYWQYGIAVLPNSNIAVAYARNKVKMYQPQGKEIWEVTLNADPWNIAVMPDGNLIVSKRKDPTLDILDVTTGKVLRSVTMKVRCSWPGLAVDTDRLIITDSDNKCFYICNHDGTVIRTVRNAVFQYPRYVSCSKNGNIIISDMAAHCVFVCSKTGDLQFTYGTPGSSGDGPGKLNTPRGVCTDNDNNILVADCNNDKVHLLTPEATFIKTVLTQDDLGGLPMAITLTPQGHIAVTILYGYVKTFKYTQAD